MPPDAARPGELASRTAVFLLRLMSLISFAIHLTESQQKYCGCTVEIAHDIWQQHERLGSISLDRMHAAVPCTICSQVLREDSQRLSL